jgi:Core-2/I-Branching enzyme
MTIAYFIMAHHKPRQLRWLMEAIYNPHDMFLLHVDLKSRLGIKADRAGVWEMAKRLADGRPNVRVLHSRLTNWGGWSLSKLQLDAIDTALAMSPDWTHFINLSGQCYPLKPAEEIRRFLDTTGDRVAVELRHFSTLPDDDWHLKWHPMIELPHKAIKFKGPRRPPADFELVYKGSQWSILPRSFCEWRQRSPVAESIVRYLRNLLLSDELIIQTLVRNGPWKDRVAGHYGREIVWPGPKVMTTEDWDRLDSSPALFARKFDAGVDENILRLLASKGAYRPPPS